MRARAIRHARILAALLGSLLLLAAPARATWSIVIVNVETGEVGVASATCLAGFDLKRWLPVVVPGIGAAAAQSAVDQSGNNRLLIWDGMHQGLSPREILEILSTQAGHNSRQYGIVTLADTEGAIFTGGSVGQARHAVTGQYGPLRFAVQGNVLTGAVVVDAAASALIETQGDLGQKLMAAMLVARQWGGDGRCSCSNLMPTSCGAPPPNFTKSCHVAFIVVARMGDVAGPCNVTTGCAAGDYYLSLQRITGTTAPDPVLTLRNDYDQWRQGLAGRPDHVLSTVQADAEALVADGLSSTTVRVTLLDIDGQPASSGSATLLVEPTSGGAPIATVGPIVPLGGGEYEFTLTAGHQAGTESFRITVENSIFWSVQLYPQLELRVDPLAPLHAGFETVAAGEGADVPFVLNLGTSAATRPYLLLGSARGTQPGQVLHGLPVPLNPDHFFAFTLGSAGGANLPGSSGTLDGLGRATARFVASPPELAPLIGRQLSWCAVIGGPQPETTPVVEITVLP